MILALRPKLTKRLAYDSPFHLTQNKSSSPEPVITIAIRSGSFFAQVPETQVDSDRFSVPCFKTNRR